MGQLTRLGRLSALVAVSALAMSSPAAAGVIGGAPEFGRCVKNAKSEGGSGFADKACTQAAAAGARYHWVAGPGPKAGFTISGSGAVLDTVSGQRVECATVSGAGQYTGPKSETLGLTLSGCKQGASACQSAGSAGGTIETAPLRGGLQILKRESKLSSNWIGLLWSPASGTVFASFECGAAGDVVTGSVLHEVIRNRMSATEQQKVRVFKNGWQNPSCSEPCESGSPHEYLETSIDGAAPVVSGLSMPSLLSSEEKIEINSVV
jgi:hypothetical protein